jgi:transcriptional regulator, XRE family
MSDFMPLAVERAVRKLGHDLSLARRRRRISQDSMAQRMGASVSTVRRIEKGDPRIPIHFIARAMMILGDLKVLENLMDTANDDIGLLLMDEQLPKRVRMPRNVSGGL